MKNFFKQYSYSIIKIFVNQFAISIFGLVLALATTAAGNSLLTMIISIFSIAFYLFLIYTMTWEIGAKDRISVDVGKKPYKPNTGLLIALVANIPNLLIAVLYTIGTPFKQSWGGNLCAVLNFISALIQGMYQGLMSVILIPPAGNALFSYWWAYFLITVPAIVATWIAYFTGFKNFRLLAQFFDQKKRANHK